MNNIKQRLSDLEQENRKLKETVSFILGLIPLTERFGAYDARYTRDCVRRYLNIGKITLSNGTLKHLESENKDD